MKATPLETLPKDRAYLHFEAVRSDDDINVYYELVLPLPETDIRGTFDRKGRKDRPKSNNTVWLDTKNNRRFPLGGTIVGSTNPNYPFFGSEEYIDLPFRDGAHQFWDNEKLGGLPVIYTNGDRHWILTPVQNQKGDAA